MDRLDEVLAQSDILVVVVPLTELTRGMIGAQQLDLLPPGALVVNIARGGIVDEAALLERLRDGRIGGVGARRVRRRAAPGGLAVVVRARTRSSRPTSRGSRRNIMHRHSTSWSRT